MISYKALSYIDSNWINYDEMQTDSTIHIPLVPFRTPIPITHLVYVYNYIYMYVYTLAAFRKRNLVHRFWTVFQKIIIIRINNTKIYDLLTKNTCGEHTHTIGHVSFYIVNIRTFSLFLKYLIGMVFNIVHVNTVNICCFLYVCFTTHLPKITFSLM